jgi:hypothetical protein
MHINTDSANGNYLLGSSLFLNILASLDKTNITFFLGVIVSLLAIFEYITKIYKNVKNTKEPKKK